MKRLFKSEQRTSLFIVLLLLGIVAAFEFLPAVEHARQMFPETFGDACDCSCVLKSRPWYGQINPWLWFWLISTPMIVFLTKPDRPVWQRAACTIVVIGLGYIAINLGTHLAMKIRNAPFHGEGIVHVDNVLVSSKEDEFKFHCYDIADGAKFYSALLFGWLYAAIYTGWWEIVWHQYHKRKTKLIDRTFKTDWINRIVIFISLAIPALMAGWILFH